MIEPDGFADRSDFDRAVLDALPGSRDRHPGERRLHAPAGFARARRLRRPLVERPPGSVARVPRRARRPRRAGMGGPGHGCHRPPGRRAAWTTGRSSCRRPSRSSTATTKASRCTHGSRKSSTGCSQEPRPGSSPGRPSRRGRQAGPGFAKANPWAKGEMTDEGGPPPSQGVRVGGRQVGTRGARSPAGRGGRGHRVLRGHCPARSPRAGVPVTPVSEVTGFPEMLGGRVKTLHLHACMPILADKREPAHLAELRDQGIEPFDLVVSSLYPFERAVASGAGPDEIIEQIDIGGPTLVRAAAKNFESVGVVVDPLATDSLIDEITRHGGLSLETRAGRRGVRAHRRLRRGDRGLVRRAGRARRRFPRSWARSRRSAALRGEPAPAWRPVRARRARPAGRGGGPAGQGDVVQQLAGCRGGAGGGRRLQRRRDREAQQPLWSAAGRTRPGLRAALDCDRCPRSAASWRSTASDEEAAAAMAGVFTEFVVAPAFTADALAVFAERENLRVVRRRCRSGPAWTFGRSTAERWSRTRTRSSRPGEVKGRVLARADPRNGATWCSPGPWRRR